MQQIVFLDSDTLDTGINLRRPIFPITGKATRPRRRIRWWGGSGAPASPSSTRCASGADELAQLPELRLIALAATGSATTWI